MIFNKSLIGKQTKNQTIIISRLYYKIKTNLGTDELFSFFSRRIEALLAKVKSTIL